MPSPLDPFFQSRYSGQAMDNLKKYTVGSILSELSGDDTSKLSNINALTTMFNSSAYSNVQEIDSMFDKAYASGETGLGTRDRMVLRAFSWAGYGIVSELTHSGPLSNVSFTDDHGIPDYTQAFITESGKTTKDMLSYCFKILYVMMSGANGQNPYTPDVINYINSTIPDKYAPKFDPTSNTIFTQGFQSNPTPATTWFLKALLIGPAYIKWVAENKWNLNLTWSP